MVYTSSKSFTTDYADLHRLNTEDLKTCYQLFKPGFGNFQAVLKINKAGTGFDEVVLRLVHFEGGSLAEPESLEADLEVFTGELLVFPFDFQETFLVLKIVECIQQSRIHPEGYVLKIVIGRTHADLCC